VWARSTIYDQNCAAHQNKTGSLIGTAFVVRDLFQVVDALNEDGLLRYWGESLPLHEHDFCGLQPLNKKGLKY
jgi:hypothetical protein